MASSPMNAKPALSREEVEILVAAADMGEIQIHSADQLGRWVRAWAIDFLLVSDPSVAVAYREALDALLRRQLVKHEGGNRYLLTSRGFKIARGISSSEEGEKIIKDLNAKFKQPEK